MRRGYFGASVIKSSRRWVFERWGHSLSLAFVCAILTRSCSDHESFVLSEHVLSFLRPCVLPLVPGGSDRKRSVIDVIGHSVDGLSDMLTCTGVLHTLM